MIDIFNAVELPIHIRSLSLGLWLFYTSSSHVTIWIFTVCLWSACLYQCLSNACRISPAAVIQQKLKQEKSHVYQRVQRMFPNVLLRCLVPLKYCETAAANFNAAAPSGISAIVNVIFPSVCRNANLHICKRACAFITAWEVFYISGALILCVLHSDIPTVG